MELDYGPQCSDPDHAQILKVNIIRLQQKQHAVDLKMTKTDILSGDSVFGGYVIVQKLKKYLTMKEVSPWFSVELKTSQAIILNFTPKYKNDDNC